MRLNELFQKGGIGRLHFSLQSVPTSNSASKATTRDSQLEKEPVDELLKELNTTKGGLTGQEAQNRLEQYGRNAIEEKKTNPVLKFLSYFWGPIPWMIEIAAVLSAILQHIPDLVIIMVLLLFNALVGFWQEFQAANAVEALKKQLALKARVKRDGRWTEIEATELVPGDIIRIRLGDIIPADVKLIEGDYLSIDQSALTGESLPVDKKIGDTAYSSSIAKQGEMVAAVSATGANTYFGRTARLVSTAKSVSHFQAAVIHIGDYLIYISLFLVVILLSVMLFRGESFLTLIQFALILVVAAIPVAMPAVLSVTMAIGAKILAKMKAIVTRLDSIEEMAGMDILCSDKTGTLTKNQLTLGDPVLFDAKDNQEVILAGSLASKEEDRDAIDLAVLAGLQDHSVMANYNQVAFVPFDPIHKRTEATITGQDGKTFRVTKGAPQVILALCQPCSADLEEKVDAAVDDYAVKGYRTLGVACNDDGDGWSFLGILPLFDPPREDSAETIRNAEAHGIQVKMVTGDNIAIAKQISSELGLGSQIHSVNDLFGDGDENKELSAEKTTKIEEADGFAQVFPEHKFQIVKALQARNHIVGMTGDGVNDAPALKQANIGVAVSGATDAARSAAELVLTAPGLSVIVNAVEEARKIFERMNSYAIYRITETIRIMIFVVVSMIAFNFYPLTTVMIILLALLNDFPIMTIAYDNTWLDPTPIRWNMRRVLTIATTLGVTGVFSTFGMLLLGKYVFGFNIDQIQSLIYLKLAVAGHLTLFLARTRSSFFRKPYPSPILIVAIIGTQIVAALIVGFGLLVTALPWKYVGIVWGYAIAWAFLLDWIKVKVYHRFNL